MKKGKKEVRSRNPKTSKNPHQESENIYKKLVEASLQGIVIAQGIPPRLDYANPAISKMLGYSSDELTSFTFEQIKKVVHPDDRSDLFGQYENHLEGKPVRPNYEVRIIRKDGNIVWLEVSATRIEYNGEPAVLATFIDITERKRAEELVRESEERYRSILENIAEGYYEVDLAGNFTFFNVSVCHLLGYSKEELMGMNNRQYMDQENAKKLYQTFNEVYRTGVTANVFDWVIIRKDGTKRHVESSISLIKNPAGQPVGFRGIVRDITERKRAEEALSISEERYRTLVEESFDGIWIQKRAKIAFANRRLYEMLGYEQGELEGHDHWIVYHPDYQALTRERAQARMRGESVPSTYEVKFLRKDGSSFWGEINAKAITLSGEPGIQVWARDINERKQAEKALKESEEKFRFLTEKMADMVWTMDLNFHTTYVSPSIEKMLGFTPEERKMQSLEQMLPPESLKKTQALFREELERQKREGIDPDRSITVEIEYYRKDGSTVWVENNIKGIYDADKWVGIYGVSRDITERKRAEETLRAERERFRSLTENAPFGMVMINQDGSFEYINPKFKELLGYDLMDIPDGKTWFRKAYPDPDYRHKVITAWIEDSKSFGVGEKKSRVFKAKCKDGSEKIINFITVQLETGENLMTCEDITDLKRAEEALRQTEEQLRQSQKMEAIGRLAGGIAHDFNNLLTVIKGYSELSLFGLKDGDVLKENINEIYKASERAANLTRQLLAFSRKQILEFKVLNLNALIQDLDKMLHRILGEDIDLIYELDENAGRVKTDRGQIEQVILNLAVNARDAMPSGGKLFIETNRVDVGETNRLAYPDIGLGSYVRLTITDTGVGMTREVKEHLFEPFFTTKAKGKGTGLGLSTVYGIVKQSGGNINVSSKPGCGTTFNIYLPRVEEEEDILKKDDHRTSPRIGNETILIAEDEQAVRELAVRILKVRGYQVYEVPDGLEALRMVQDHPDRKIDLLLTDVVMPGMSGKELADRLKVSKPDLKVLFISGYTDDAIVHHGVLDKGVNFVQKPFTPEALAQKVREVLDQ